MPGLADHLRRAGADLPRLRSPAPAVPTDPAAVVEAWASSGGLHLTGWPAQAPLVGPAPLLAGAAELAALVTGMTAGRVEVDVAEVLFGRAGWLGLRRRGRRSAGGACRLLRARDGWVAVSLARPSDVEVVPAIVEGAPGGATPWGALARYTRVRPAVAVADRAQLLGVPAAAVGEARDLTATPVVAERLGRPRPRPARPLVVDLSALWAGPLCARLLGLAGARVVKVELASRLDGARRGHPGFYRWLHAGHESVVLDVANRDGVGRLVQLLERADVVIEGSRPRALAQLGIDGRRLAAAAGTTWVSITGYGRDRDRVAFGDDAAAAAGVLARDHDGGPTFCADALADPLTGLVAAAAALAVPGPALVSVPMAAVAAHAWARGHALVGGPIAAPVRRAGPDRWEVAVDGRAAWVEVRPPRPPRLPAARAAEPGEHTAAVLAELVP